MTLPDPSRFTPHAWAQAATSSKPRPPSLHGSGVLRRGRAALPSATSTRTVGSATIVSWNGVRAWRTALLASSDTTSSSRSPISGGSSTATSRATWRASVTLAATASRRASV